MVLGVGNDVVELLCIGSATRNKKKTEEKTILTFWSRRVKEFF